MGVLMMLGFWIANWDFANGIVNEQLILAVVTGILGYTAAGKIHGLDRAVEESEMVQRTPALKYVLG